MLTGLSRPSWEEFKAYKKEEWKRLNQGRQFTIFAKKICPKCGRTFNCHSCYMEYYLCHRSTDYKRVSEGPWKECLCAECLEKELGFKEGGECQEGRSGEKRSNEPESKLGTTVWNASGPPNPSL